MRILITGATAWTDKLAIHRELSKMPAGSTIVTGDTSGVDAIAKQLASELGFKLEAMAKTKSDYQHKPKAAWQVLNERMLATGIDVVLAFHAELGQVGKARGTQHALDIAKQAGIACHAFTH